MTILVMQHLKMVEVEKVVLETLTSLTLSQIFLKTFLEKVLVVDHEGEEQEDQIEDQI